MLELDKLGVRPHRILLADDHAMIVDLISNYICSTLGGTVETASNFDDAFKIAQEGSEFDVVILDWNMPSMNGVHSLRRMIGLKSPARVVVLTGDPNPRIIRESMAAGAFGVLSKALGLGTLIAAIRTICLGERYIPYELLLQSREVDKPHCKLTPKEREILGEISKGKKNKEICADLDLALPTVKMHISSLVKKLSANNRLHATVVARDLGII